LVVGIALAVALTGCSSGGDASVDLKSDHSDNAAKLHVTLQKDDSITVKSTRPNMDDESVGVKWTIKNDGDQPATNIYAVSIDAESGGLPNKEVDEAKLPDGAKADPLDSSAGSTIKPGESVSGYSVVALTKGKIEVSAAIESGGEYSGTFEAKGTVFEKK
jgi:hypothetical protein